MSRIIDVVNKIMQISGEMNTLRSEVSRGNSNSKFKFKRFQREKCFIFEIYNWKCMGKQKDAVDK